MQVRYEKKGKFGIIKWLLAIEARKKGVKCKCKNKTKYDFH